MSYRNTGGHHIIFLHVTKAYVWPSTEIIWRTRKAEANVTSNNIPILCQYESIALVHRKIILAPTGLFKIHLKLN